MTAGMGKKNYVARCRDGIGEESSTAAAAIGELLGLFDMGCVIGPGLADSWEIEPQFDRRGREALKKMATTVPIGDAMWERGRVSSTGLPEATVGTPT